MSEVVVVLVIAFIAWRFGRRRIGKTGQGDTAAPGPGYVTPLRGISPAAAEAVPSGAGDEKEVKVPADDRSFEEKYGPHHCDGLRCNPYTCCNNAERLMCRTVIQELAVPPEDVAGQYLLRLRSRWRRLDFAIRCPSGRGIAIEMDGYTYHGNIDKKEFKEQLRRQNELILKGWKVLRFTFNQVAHAPAYCRDVIQEVYDGDAENRTDGLRLPPVYAEVTRLKNSDLAKQHEVVYTGTENQHIAACTNEEIFRLLADESVQFWMKCQTEGCTGRVIRRPSKFGENQFYWKCYTCNTTYPIVNGLPVFPSTSRRTSST